MGTVIFQGVLAFASVAALLIAIFGFFNKTKAYDRALNEAQRKYGKTFRATIVAFFRIYWLRFILLVFSLSCGLAFSMIAICVPPPGIIPDETPTPPATIIPPKQTPQVMNGQAETRLVQLRPLEINEDAFFFDVWDEHNSIKIEKKEYDQSIGVKIPQKDQEYYYKYFNLQTKTHDEYIEYSLAEKYKTLTFDYGIDDSSFPKDRSCSSQCKFWIDVQKCSSEKDYFEKEDLLFKTIELNKYQTLESTGPIDVSGAEAIRITVHWRFDVIQTKPLAFNIAIVNPMLSPA